MLISKKTEIKKNFILIFLTVASLFIGLCSFPNRVFARSVATTIIVQLDSDSHDLDVSTSTDTAVSGGSKWQVTASPEYKSVGALVSFSALANQSAVNNDKFGSSFVVSDVNASNQWSSGAKGSTNYSKLKSLIGSPATGDMFPDDSTLNGDSVSNSSKTKGGNILAFTFPGWAFTNNSWNTKSKALVSNSDDNAPDWFSSLDESSNASTVENTMLSDMNGIMEDVYNHMTSSSQSNFDNNTNAATANLALLVGSGWGHVGGKNNVVVNSKGQFTGAGLTRGTLSKEGHSIYISWSGSNGGQQLYGTTKGPSYTYSGTWDADVRYVTWSTAALEADSALYSTAGAHTTSGGNSTSSTSDGITTNEISDTFKDATGAITGSFHLGTAGQLIFNYGGLQNTLVTSDQFGFIRSVAFLTGVIGFLLLLVGAVLTVLRAAKAIGQGGVERTSQIAKSVLNNLKYVVIIIFWVAGLLIAVNLLAKFIWIIYTWLPSSAQKNLDGGFSGVGGELFSWLTKFLFWFAGIVPNVYYILRSLEFMMWAGMGPIFIAIDGLKGTSDFSNSNTSRMIRRIIPLFLTQVLQAFIYLIISYAFGQNGLVNFINSLFIVFLTDKWLSSMGFSSGSFFGAKGFKEMGKQISNSALAQSLRNGAQSYGRIKDGLSGNRSSDRLSANQAMKTIAQRALDNGESNVTLPDGSIVSAAALARKTSDPGLGSKLKDIRDRRTARRALIADQHGKEQRAMAAQALVASQEAGGGATAKGRALARLSQSLGKSADEAEQHLANGHTGLNPLHPIASLGDMAATIGEDGGLWHAVKKLPNHVISGVVRKAVISSKDHGGNKLKSIAGTLGEQYASTYSIPATGSQKIIQSALTSNDANTMMDALRNTGGMGTLGSNPTMSDLKNELVKRQSSLANNLGNAVPTTSSDGSTSTSNPSVADASLGGLGAVAAGAGALATNRLMRPASSRVEKVLHKQSDSSSFPNQQNQSLFNKLKQNGLDQEAKLATSTDDMAAFAATQLDNLTSTAGQQLLKIQQSFQSHLTKTQTRALTTAINSAASDSSVTLSSKSVRDMTDLLSRNATTKMMHQDKGFNNLTTSLKNVADRAMRNAESNSDIHAMHQSQLQALSRLHDDLTNSTKNLKNSYQDQFKALSNYKDKYGVKSLNTLKNNYANDASKHIINNNKTINTSNKTVNNTDRSRSIVENRTNNTNRSVLNKNKFKNYSGQPIANGVNDTISSGNMESPIGRLNPKDLVDGK